MGSHILCGLFFSVTIRKMRNYIIIGVLVIFALGVYFFSNSSPIIKNYPPKNDTIVAFGDSLVRGVGATNGEGFVFLLSQKIGKPIINLGVSGDTTAEGLARISNVTKRNPGTVLVLLGGNDYLKKVPQEETFENLREIITKLQSNGAMVVLLGVRGGVLSDKFGNDFQSLARETGSVYVPDVLDGIITNRSLMYDTVHPNDKGYALIAEKVYERVAKYIR